MTILDEIFAFKHEEVAASRRIRPLAEVRRLAEAAPPALSFKAALKRPSTHSPLRLIAEVKCASPSRGLLAADFNPTQLAAVYQQNGASAISVLTDENFFKGSLAYLEQIKTLNLGLPLLRKDFIFDPYQVFEARAAGADAILLIAAHLDNPLLADLHALALETGMAALVEVHNEAELSKALTFSPEFIGINNRNLHDFTVDINTCLRLSLNLPSGVILVAESGIQSAADAALLRASRIDAMLVGEALVTAPDTGRMIRSLLS